MHDTGFVRLLELTPGATYDYAVVATNYVGTTIGPNVAFTASAPTPPVVLTGEAVGVAQLSATLTATIETRGLQTISSFEFGTTPALGTPESASVVGAATETLYIAAAFGNYLQAGTTYYYRAVASNADGVSYGAVRSFIAPAPPPPAIAPTPPFIVPQEQLNQLPESRKVVLTRAQKFAKALKACAKKPRSKRRACKAQARRKYGPRRKK